MRSKIWYFKIRCFSHLFAVFKRSTVWTFCGRLGEYGNWILLAVVCGKQSPSSAAIFSLWVPRHRSHSFNLWRKGQIVARRTCKDWKQARSIPGRRLHRLLCLAAWDRAKVKRKRRLSDDLLDNMIPSDEDEGGVDLWIPWKKIKVHFYLEIRV